MCHLFYVFSIYPFNIGMIKLQYSMVVCLSLCGLQKKTCTGHTESLSSQRSVQILQTCYHSYPQDKTDRVIKHYQLTSQWPDYDVPDSTGPVLEFVKFVRSKEGPFKEENGPTLVHCGLVSLSSSDIVCESTCV